MQADGYSLDQKRTAVADNDIPDVIARFHNLEAEADRLRTDKSFLVPADEIREHDFDLAFNTYKETIREVVEYEAPEVIINRAAALASKISDGINSLQSLINSHHEA